MDHDWVNWLNQSYMAPVTEDKVSVSWLNLSFTAHLAGDKESVSIAAQYAMTG